MKTDVKNIKLTMIIDKFKSENNIANQNQIKNKWISTDERYPTKDGIYLIRISKINKIKSLCKIGFDINAYGGYFKIKDWQFATHWKLIQ